MKFFLVFGSLNALIGVGLGAFGAHGLKAKVTTEMLAAWNTAVLYHLIHALGLLMIGILCQLLPGVPLVRSAGWAILVGILFFSGSLYLMVLSNTRWLGMITPLGGCAFMVGWLLLALAAWRHTGKS